MKIEELKIGQTVYVKGIITDIEEDEILDLEIHTSENNFCVNSSDVYVSIDQPKLKIPQFMLDWVDDSRERYYEFDEWFDPDNQPMKVYKWLNCKNKRQADINALALVTLIVNGPDAVTVEKEKLYTVVIPNPHEKQLSYVLMRQPNGNVIINVVHSSNLDLLKTDNDLQLTEKEIKKDFDWAWQWKKEVTE
ncbi:DUF1642 domain-containing protein [Streptococcus uberis]|uniref:DUF1642 domain-containing protein n=1 Tax=Streptococcus uberis TaxID=1349 RepID=UPI001FF187DB|nr:DUF1642 domain-containing protein [Streptococcus uberis]MCK1187787.1 DUF1642 domain-containing protein [Streptococcus uberis]